MMGVFLALFPFVYQQINWSRLKSIPFYTFLAFCVWSLLGILIHQRWDDFSFLNKLVSVLAVVIFALPLQKKDYLKVIYGFLAGSASLLLISIVKLYFHYAQFGTLKLDVGKEVNELLMGERPFLGFFYLISICLCFYLITKFQKKSIQIILLIASCIWASFILFISARLSILSLMIILGLSVFYAKNKIKAFTCVGIGVVGIVAFILTNPTFKSRLTAGFAQENLELQKVIAMEPRSHIWTCAYQIVQNEALPILGFGYRNTVDKLVNCYETREGFFDEEHRSYFVNSRFNTHNQYLNTLLSTGIIGLIILLLFIFSLVLQSRMTYAQIAIVMALALFFIFENVLSRQLGAVLVGFVWVTSLFLSCKPNNSTKDNLRQE
jgi:O-antigen ligase